MVIGSEATEASSSNDTAVLNGPEAPEEAAEPPGRRALVWLGLIAVVCTAVVSSNMFSIRDRLLGSAVPEPAPPAAGRAVTEGTVPAETALRSHPWWQDVTTLEGTGTTTAAPVTITDDAIQWRVTWTCESGNLTVRSPGQPEPLVDSACSDEGSPGYATQPGTTELEVTADGPWRLEIAQQIDAPLVEPPLPAMTAPGAAAVATGSFYNIDRTGTGNVTIYRQADGRYSLRLDDFFVSPNSDLEIRLSPLDAPRTSEEFMSTPSPSVVTMDVTAGSINYTVPADIDPTQFRSVVIWCGPISSAYAAASLETAP